MVTGLSKETKVVTMPPNVRAVTKWMLSVCVMLLVLTRPLSAQVLDTQLVTAQSTGSGCTTAQSCASFQAGNSASLVLQVSGTFSGTLTFEATADGINWASVMMVKLADGTSATTTTAAGQFSIGNAGILQVRARATSWSSGTATVTATRGWVLARWLTPAYSQIVTPLIIGGTGTTSTLTLEPTSGAGTTGADIIFNVGNNGGTQAMRMFTGGGIDIGIPISGLSGSGNPGTVSIGTAAAGAFQIGNSSSSYSSFTHNTDLILYSNSAGLQLWSSGVRRWSIPTTGHIVAFVDNTYDIGAAGATRPRTVYAGTSVIAPLFQSTAAKVLVQGTGSGATQLAATQTTPPTCSTNCGTSPGVVGTDTAGIITMGGTGSPASGFVLTFNGTWAAAPACVVNMALAGMVVGKQPLTVATTTGQFTVVTNGTAPGNSDKYAYVCVGVQ